jgi:hypothetical protein
LSAQGVAGDQYGVATAEFDGDSQMSGFCGYVAASSQANASEWLFFSEAFLNLSQNGHFPAGPLNALLSQRGEGQVFDFVFNLDGCSNHVCYFSEIIKLC